MARNNLARVPKIIEYLERKGALTVSQAENIRAAIRHNEYPGMFAGEIVVEKGYMDTRTLDQQLCERALDKVMAALDDLRFMRANQGITLEEWQTPYFGDQGVVKNTRENISRRGAAAITANIARLIVFLAADNPEVAQEGDVYEGLIAARDLVQAMMHGDSSFAPLAQHTDDWLQQLQDTLYKVGVKAGVEEETLTLYIKNRFAEIRQGIEKTLKDN